MEWGVGFDEEDLLVAGVLAGLSDAILAPESRPIPSLPSWGVRKKRSAVLASDGGARLPAATAFEDQEAAKAKVDSPATPLSFPRSESDEKLNRFKGASRKRKGEELLVTVMDCTERRDFLQGELEAARLHCERLKSFNLELKAKKQQLLVRHEIGTSHDSEALLLNPTLTLQLGQHAAVADPHLSVLHQLPSAFDPAAPGTGQRRRPHIKIAAPFVLDLNVSAWEAGDVDSLKPSDLSPYVPDERARAAEARKRRRMLQRLKGNYYAASRRRMLR